MSDKVEVPVDALVKIAQECASLRAQIRSLEKEIDRLRAPAAPGPERCGHERWTEYLRGPNTCHKCGAEYREGEGWTGGRP